ncbi:MAG: MFS transporter [Burkholderiales bacterium]|nr:MFS transporter [Anaerolineae bacterium]
MDTTISQTELKTARWALAVLCIAQFMVVLDTSIVNVALPSIQTSLGFTPQDLQWIVTGYSLTFGGLLLLAGRISDLFGRRRFLQLGLILFTVASLIGGLTDQQSLLLAARALQGVGAAFVSPAALSLLTTTFAEGAPRNRALGVWAAAAAAGAAAGVLLGGFLTDQFGWRAVFFVNVPIGIITALATPLVLRESRKSKDGTTLDIAGALAITFTLMLLVYSLTQVETAGANGGRLLLLIGLTVVGFASFIMIENKTRDPLIPLHIFRLRSLTGANIVSFIVAAEISAMAYLTSLYMQRSLNFTALQTGAAFLPSTLTIMVMSGVGARLMGRVGAKRLMVIGLLFIAFGMLLLSLLPVQGDYIRDLVPGFTLVSLGMGLTFVSSTIVATAGVDDAQQGLASGLLNTSQQIGGAVGLALFVLIAVLRTASVGSSDDSSISAIVDGYRWAFAAAGFAALVAVAITYAILPNTQPVPSEQ